MLPISASYAYSYYPASGIQSVSAFGTTGDTQDSGATTQAGSASAAAPDARDVFAQFSAALQSYFAQMQTSTTQDPQTDSAGGTAATGQVANQAPPPPGGAQGAHHGHHHHRQAESADSTLSSDMSKLVSDMMSGSGGSSSADATASGAGDTLQADFAQLQSDVTARLKGQASGTASDGTSGAAGSATATSPDDATRQVSHELMRDLMQAVHAYQRNAGGQGASLTF